MLINLTCLSVQASLHLSKVHGASTLYDKILELMRKHEVANDAAWLLSHLVTDGAPNLAKLFSGNLFRVMSMQLQSTDGIEASPLQLDTAVKLL